MKQKGYRIDKSGDCFYEWSDLKEFILIETEGYNDLNEFPVYKDPELATTLKELTIQVLKATEMALGNKEAFISSFGLSVRKHVTFELEAPMAVNLTSDGLSARMNLFVNPFYVLWKGGVKTTKDGQDNSFIDETTYKTPALILIHEYLHLLHEHVINYEFASKNGYHTAVNLATDCFINQYDSIKKDKVLTEYGVTLDSIKQLTNNPSLRANDSSGYYFDQLLKAITDYQKQQNQSSPNPNGCCSRCGKPKGNDQSDQQQGQQSQNGNQSGQQGQDGNQQGQQNQSCDQQGQGQDNNQSGQQGQGELQGEQQGQNGNQQGQQNQNSGQSQNQNGSQQQHGQNGDQGEYCSCGNHHGNNPFDSQDKRSSGRRSHEAWYKTPGDVQTEDGEDLGEVASTDTAKAELARAVKAAMENSGDSESQLKSRGLVSQGLLDLAIRGVNSKGKLPIKSLLMKGAGRLKLNKEATYARPNKRQGTQVRILKGERFENAKTITVFVDNSGSMSKNELEWCLKETAAVARKLKAELVVIPFDTQVYGDNKQTVKKNGSFNFVPVGRGGTSFQPVLDYCKAHKFDNQKDLVVVFTDGYGESVLQYHGFNNLVWVLVEETKNTLSVSNVIGYVGWLSNDHKYQLHKAKNGIV